MRKLLMPLMLLSLVSSCNMVNDAKEKVAKGATETLIEKATGHKVDAADVSNVDKNKVIVQLTLDGESLQRNFEGGMGTITATPGTIAITASKETDGKHESILIGFTATELGGIKPLKGSVAGGSDMDAKFQFSISSISENEMYTMIAQEGTAVVESLNDSKVFIRIDAKIAAPQDSEHPEKWKTVKGSLTIDYPLFNAMGMKKNEIAY